MTAKISGGCACGAVRYEIAADPQFQGQCQCRDCQRATGTGHADGLGFPENAVALVGTLSFYEVIGDSGKTVSRGFCPKCGSPVLEIRSESWRCCNHGRQPGQPWHIQAPSRALCLTGACVGPSESRTAEVREVAAERLSSGRRTQRLQLCG